MWNVYRGDPLDIQLECLDEDEVAVDLTGYTVGVNLVWGDDEDERLELVPEVTEATGAVIASVTALEIDDLPLGKKTIVFLLLTPSGGNQYTTQVGRITVRDA
jgi:hypothetical protein